LTRQEHDQIFRDSPMSKMLGVPPQDFLDTHWDKIMENGLAAHPPRVLKMFLDSSWGIWKKVICKDLNISEN